MDLFSQVGKLPISHTLKLQQDGIWVFVQSQYGKAVSYALLFTDFPKQQTDSRIHICLDDFRVALSYTKLDKWVSVHMCTLSLVPLGSIEHETSNSGSVKAPQKKHRLH